MKQSILTPTRSFSSRPWHRLALGLSGLLLLTLALTPIEGRAQDDDDDASQPPWAVIYTNQGTMVFELYEKKVPRVVRHFVGLTTGDKSWTHPKTKKKMSKPFYDGLTFHKLVPTYWVMGGCPLGNGKGGPGFTVKDQYHPDLRHKGAGILSLSNAGARGSGSQFFITLRTAPWLDHKTHTLKACKNYSAPIKCRTNADCQSYKKMFPKASKGPAVCATRTIHKGYSVFGKIAHGLRVLNKIAELPVDVNGRPIQPVKIKAIRIRRARKWKRSWLKMPN